MRSPCLMALEFRLVFTGIFFNLYHHIKLMQIEFCKTYLYCLLFFSFFFLSFFSFFVSVSIFKISDIFMPSIWKNVHRRNEVLRFWFQFLNYLVFTRNGKYLLFSMILVNFCRSQSSVCYSVVAVLPAILLVSRNMFKISTKDSTIIPGDPASKPLRYRSAVASPICDVVRFGTMCTI